MVQSKTILLSMIVTLLTINPVLADADKDHSYSKKKQLSMLNLTEDQLARWGDLKKAQQKTMRSYSLKLRATRELLKIAFQTSDNESDIREKAEALSSLLLTIRSSELDYQIDIWKILTPDQRLLVGVPGERLGIGQNKLRNADPDKRQAMCRYKKHAHKKNKGYVKSWRHKTKDK